MHTAGRKEGRKERKKEGMKEGITQMSLDSSCLFVESVCVCVGIKE